MLLVRLVNIILYRTGQSKDTGITKDTLEPAAISFSWTTLQTSSSTSPTTPSRSTLKNMESMKMGTNSATITSTNILSTITKQPTD